MKPRLALAPFEGDSGGGSNLTERQAVKNAVVLALPRLPRDGEFRANERGSVPVTIWSGGEVVELGPS